MSIEHPGKELHQMILRYDHISISEIAKKLNVTRPTLSNLFNGKSNLSPEMALRIEKLYDFSALYWLEKQALWDLLEARKSFKF